MYKGHVGDVLGMHPRNVDESFTLDLQDRVGDSNLDCVTEHDVGSTG